MYSREGQRSVAWSFSARRLSHAHAAAGLFASSRVFSFERQNLLRLRQTLYPAKNRGGWIHGMPS